MVDEEDIGLAGEPSLANASRERRQRRPRHRPCAADGAETWAAVVDAVIVALSSGDKGRGTCSAGSRGPSRLSPN